MTQSKRHTTYPDTPQLTDIQRIARSLRRYALLSKYSHGTIKRSTMAMINLYIKQSAHPPLKHPHDWHAVM